MVDGVQCWARNVDGIPHGDWQVDPDRFCPGCRDDGWGRPVSEPEPPVGLWATWDDDSTEPIVEVVYAGVVDGTHEWRAAVFPNGRRLVSWGMAVMPAHTSVRLQVVERTEESVTATEYTSRRHLP